MEPQGYNYAPPQGQGGKAGWVQLPKKGDSARLRLAVAPIHYQKKTTYGGVEKEATRFLWVALQRLQTGDEVRIYEAGVDVYREIKKYNDDPEWGDPSTYDITITRNMQTIGEGGAGDFYSVVPSPAKRPLTPEEMQKIADAGIDLVVLAQRLAAKSGASTTEAKPTSTFGTPAAPAAAPAPEDQNPDDMPF